MDLTARDAARMLNVPEEKIHGWIRNGTLPAYRVKDRYRLDRVELLEWAAARNIRVEPEFFSLKQEADDELLLTHALARGGVLRDVPCIDKVSALKEVCALMTLPVDIDRHELHSVLVAREALCSTGIGNGVAIPHPRGPLVLGLSEPQVSLAFLRQAIDYRALDNKPVSILFVIISTTVHIHLKLLSHLMFVLQDGEFRRLLDQRAGESVLFARVADIERRVLKGERSEGGSR